MAAEKMKPSNVGARNGIRPVKSLHQNPLLGKSKERPADPGLGLPGKRPLKRRKTTASAPQWGPMTQLRPRSP